MNLLFQNVIYFLSCLLPDNCYPAFCLFLSCMLLQYINSTSFDRVIYSASQISRTVLTSIILITDYQTYSNMLHNRIESFNQVQEPGECVNGKTCQYNIFYPNLKICGSSRYRIQPKKVMIIIIIIIIYYYYSCNCVQVSPGNPIVMFLL